MLLSNSERLSQRIGLWCLSGLTVVLPLSRVTAWRSLFFAGVVLAALWLFASRMSNGRDRTSPPLIWAFGLWMVAAVVALPDGPNRADVMALAMQEVGKGTLLFYCTYELARGVGALRHIYWSGLVSIMAVSAVAVWSWMAHRTWTAVGVVPALGDYATSVLTLLPLVGFAFVQGWREELGRFARPMAVIGLALAMAGGVLTMSRSVWLVLAIMLAVLLGLWNGRQLRNWRRGLLWSLVSGGLLLFVALLVARWRGMDLLFFSARKDIYGPVFEHILESPWTGFGYGHESAKAWYLEHMVEPGVFHAHNLLLSYAEQMGVLGLAALFAIFGGLIHRFFKGMGPAGSLTLAPAALGVALVVGVFVKNNLDIFFVRHNLLLFFICTGMLLGLLEGEQDRPAGEEQVP